MRLGFGFAIFLSLISVSNLARGEVTQAYYDSKIQQELVEFAEKLVGTEFDSSICLPNIKKCKNTKFSQFPWTNAIPLERIYYLVRGESHVEQYDDIWVLLVEMNNENIILETKLLFIYDDNDFLSREITPRFIDFKDLKTYFPILKEYVRINEFNVDETISFIDNSALVFRPNLSSLGKRAYQTPRRPESHNFSPIPIEARAGFSFSHDGTEYLRVTQSEDGAVKLEYSKNSSHWVSSPTVK